jgi:hypothetical protein
MGWLNFESGCPDQPIRRSDSRNRPFAYIPGGAKIKKFAPRESGRKSGPFERFRGLGGERFRHHMTGRRGFVQAETIR